MFGRVAAGLVHDLSHPIQNIGNSTRLLLRDDVDPESRDMFRRTIERELADAQALHGRPAPRRQAEADRALRDGRQRVGRRDRRVDARRRRAQRRHRRGALRAGPARHRRRPLRARPRLPQPDHQRDSGDRSRRPRHHRDRRAPAIRSRSASPTPARAFRPSGSRRSSTTSSRPSAAASASASRSPSASSNSSTARSTSQSEVGRGTAFTLRFPARDDRSAQAAAS